MIRVTGIFSIETMTIITPTLSLLRQLPHLLDKGVEQLKAQAFDRLLVDRELIAPTWGRGEVIDEPINRLVAGDNLEVLAALAVETEFQPLDLIYVDPPFESNRDYHARMVHLNVEALAYSDKWENGLVSYLQFMIPRFILMRELLAETGSFYIHIDSRVSHYLKLLLDEIFGRENFRNEIIWQRDSAGKGAKGTARQWSRENDHLLFYTKSTAYPFQTIYRDQLTPTQLREYLYTEPETGRCFKKVQLGDYSRESIEKMREENRIYTTSTGRDYKKYYLDEARYPVGSNWTDIVNLSKGQREQSGYPTQKPEKLLERIILASCPEGGRVADFFAGSGTTGVVAEKLNRRWLLTDTSSSGLAIFQRRLAVLNDQRPYVVQKISAAADKPTKKKPRLQVAPLQWGEGKAIEGWQLNIELAKYTPRVPMLKREKNSQRENSLEWLSHWGVDPDYDEVIFRPRWQFYRSLGGKRTEPLMLTTQATVPIPDSWVSELASKTFCVRVVDVFGDEAMALCSYPPLDEKG